METQTNMQQGNLDSDCVCVDAVRDRALHLVFERC